MSLFLLSIHGQDRSGITKSVTAELSNFDTEVLDIGQAVIHDQLALSLLVRIDLAAERAIEAVKGRLAPLGLKCRATAVSTEEYEEWVSQEKSDRFVLTLLARRIQAGYLAKLTNLLSEKGLNIRSMSRLSGRLSVTHPPEAPRGCVEFSLVGQEVDEASVRAGLIQLAGENDFDVAFQRDDMFRRNRRLVVFDMDSTLIQTEVIDELAKEAGSGEKVAAITEQAMRGELDFTQSFKERVSTLKGLPESVLQKIAQRLPVTEGAERLIKTLKQIGYRTAVVSGGFEYFGNYLKDKLGLDYVFANELHIRDGGVTGEVHSRVIDGNRKAEIVKELAEKLSIRLEQVIVVGDGANDVPMMSIAGLGIAFRAKPMVREKADQSIRTLGLDAILYLMGIRDREARIYT